jgi:hypothetical protein
MASVPSHVIPLRLVQPATIDLPRALSILVDRAPEWLGTPVPGPRSDIRRYLTDLSLPIREHAPSLTFKKAAYVDLGEVRSGQKSGDIQIGWRSASLAPLFPVFAGHLTLTPTELRLEGYYAPPAGDLGAILDRAFLNIAARGTARWFLGRATEVIEAAPGDG